MSVRIGSIVILAAAFMWCGLAAQGADTVTPRVAIALGTDGAALALESAAPFYQTRNLIVSARGIGIPGTAGAAVIWTEVGAADELREYYAISLDGQRFSRPFAKQNEIALRYVQFDPLQDAPRVPAALQADADNSLFLVQLETQALPAWQEAIVALGGTVYGLLSGNTLEVEMTPAVRDAVAQLAFVRWVGPLHPAYKLDEAVLADLESDANTVPRDYSVMVFGSGVEQQPVVDYVLAAGGQVMNVAPDGFRMTVTVTSAQALEIARLNEVQFIDPWGPGETDMSFVRQMVGAVPNLSGLGFLGQGVRGEVFDSEVDSTHPEWNGQRPLIHAVDGFSSVHGTSCYGICFSTGVVQPTATGLLPQREQGIFCWYENSTQFGGAWSRLTLNTEATDPNGPYRSSFQTSSVGSPRTQQYTSISAEVDDYLFRVDYLSTQSMSNANLTPDVRPQAWAKNIVGVGGVTTQKTLNRLDDSAYGSSGPASDGRIKPDLASPQDSLYTTSRGGGYTSFCCTSGATPVTAGCFGLLLQMWHEEVFPGFGGGPSVFDDRPKSTTARALMINTAYRYDWTLGGPNASLKRDNQGWGMPDLDHLYATADKMLIINETDVLAPLATKEYGVVVPPGEPELAVTLVYIDRPGNPANQAQHRVNDLSLKVSAPGGTNYWGNYGLRSGNYNLPEGTPDDKNTVENVFVAQPSAGVWKIEIHGDEILQDTHLETPEVDADYGLVVRGVSRVVRGDLNCDGLVDFGDINPFVQALSDPVGWQAAHPGCPLANGDINEDGKVDFADINPFVSLLTNPG